MAHQDHSCAISSSPLDQLYQQLITVQIFETGSVHIDGLCNRYDTRYPMDLRGVISKDDFMEEMLKLHEFMDDLIAGTERSFYYGLVFCCCTMGISMIPLLYKVRHYERHVREYLEKKNRTKYQHLGIRWGIAAPVRRGEKSYVGAHIEYCNE